MVLTWIKIRSRIPVGLFHNALWLLSEKAVKALCMLIINSLLARHFAPNLYGQLAYAIAFIAIFQGVASLGLDAITLRDFSQDPKYSNKIIGTVFGLRLLMGAILWPTVCITALFLNPGDNTELTLILLAGGLLLFQASETIDLWLQSQRQSKKSVIARITIHLTGSGFRLYLLEKNCPIWLFAAMITVDALLLTIALLQAYRTHPIKKTWIFDISLAKELVRESWPYMLSGLAIMIYARIDQILIKNLIDGYNLGVYSVAILISGLFAILPVSLCAALAPHIATLKQTSQLDYMRTIKIVSVFFLAMAICICICVLISAELLLEILFGDQYALSADVLKIHIWTNVPLFLGVAQSLWIVNERRGHIYLYKTASSAALCISLNLILLPLIGIKAAAIVSVITSMFSAIFSNIIWDREYFKIQLQIIFNPISVFR